MAREDLLEEILATPVWDTHTHLTVDALPAKSFWDIGHYFWFLRELQAAGYPRDAEELPEEKRIAAYVDAFAATRNTSMNWVVRHIFENLYSIEIKDAESIRAADHAVRQTAQQRDWPQAVVDRLSIRRICVHGRSHREFSDLPDVACTIPIDANIDRGVLVERVATALDRCAVASEVAQEIDLAVKELAQAGITCVRASTAPFEQLGAAAYEVCEELPAADASRQEIEAFVGHALFRAFEAYGIAAQFFLGVQQTTSSLSIAVNDTRRVSNLHGLFERHNCRFELVVGAELSNLDVIQAARAFPNVYVGGMWWYNFRASTYRQSMQYRLEALPSSKCALVASDARCIEWCYGKILLVKYLLAEFLYEQIERGWLDYDGALYVARNWLHDTAAKLYGATR
jgi:glucuronate isomerase